MTTPVSAAIYARISSDVTGEGLGVQRQLEDCRKLAADHGWIVGHEYVDNDYSAFGSKPRPAYQDMLADIEAGMRDAVIVYNQDRLLRQPIELEQLTDLCTKAGVTRLKTVTGDIDLGNDDGVFMARIFVAYAAKESARKSARAKRKGLQTAEQGKPHGGATRPFGYAQDKTEVVAPEADAIRTVATRYLAGESVRSLCVWLNTQEIRTATGGEWRSSALRQVLASGRIAGLREYHGKVIGPAMWEPIITPDQHHQILSVMEARKSAGTRAPRRYLLSGLLRCGKCGHKLMSQARVDRRRYVCISGVDQGGCGGIMVTAPPVEELLMKAVLSRLDTPELAETLAGRSATDERQKHVMEQLEADKAQMLELTAFWVAKEISSAEWKAAREPIERRIQQAARQLAQSSQTRTLDGLVGHGAELRGKWQTLNLDRQAAIVRSVIDYATVMPATQAGAFDPRRIVPAWRL